jgi:hypothetical protein
MTAANVFGGIAAPAYAVIDAASGANYHYDSPIVVSLGKPVAAQAAALPVAPPATLPATLPPPLKPSTQ